MHQEPIETVIHQGHEIKVFQDEQPMDSPNDWAPDYVCLIYDHRDFAVFPVINNVKLDSGDCYAIFEDWSKKIDVTEYGGVTYWVFPVFAYIHSGVMLYLTRAAAMQYEPTGFDTSFKGFCLVSKTYQEDRNEARKYAQSHIDAWNQLNGGEVYGYMCEFTNESCWGFYGDEGKKQMLEEAKAEIDSKIAELSVAS